MPRCSKQGFGIVEVLIAALVLGLLYTAVSNLQKGNRDALLRIRGRDGATEVAQNIIDSLGALGLSQFSEQNLVKVNGRWTLAKDDGTGNKVKDQIKVTRVWKGQPGLVQHDMTVVYTIDVEVSSDDDYKASVGSKLLGVDCASSSSTCASHVYAKRLDVTVSWPFKQSTQSITVSGVIR